MTDEQTVVVAFHDESGHLATVRVTPGKALGMMVWASQSRVIDYTKVNGRVYQVEIARVSTMVPGYGVDVELRTLRETGRPAKLDKLPKTMTWKQYVEKYGEEP